MAIVANSTEGSEKNRILRLMEKPARFHVKAAESKLPAEEESKPPENSLRR